jgi:cytosine/adenosine deaminase-related metal-dependent hydrolase
VNGYRFTGAVAIVVDGRTERGAGAELVVRDGVVHESARGDETEIDATGCVITPGLVNAHHHLLQSAFRTDPGTRSVPMSVWLETMAAYARIGVDAELAGAAAAVGIAEGLLAGVTTVADHHLTWPTGADGLAIATARRPMPLSPSVVGSSSCAAPPATIRRRRPHARPRSPPRGSAPIRPRTRPSRA